MLETRGDKKEETLKVEEKIEEKLIIYLQENTPKKCIKKSQVIDCWRYEGSGDRFCSDFPANGSQLTKLIFMVIIIIIIIIIVITIIITIDSS